MKRTVRRKIMVYALVGKEAQEKGLRADELLKHVLGLVDGKGGGTESKAQGVFYEDIEIDDSADLEDKPKAIDASP